jgi:hypothetical protein
MTGHPQQASLVSKLTLVVLVLILACLVILVFKSFEQAPIPTEQTASAEVSIPVPDPPEATKPVGFPSRIEPRVSSKPWSKTEGNRPPPFAQRASAWTPPAWDDPPVSAPAPAATTSPQEPATGIAGTATPLRFEAEPAGSEMRLEGDSSAHAWSCVSKIVSGYFMVEPAWLTDLSLKSVSSLRETGRPPECVVKVPVRTLRSQVQVGASVMDNRLQAELKAKTFPNIEYRLTRMVIKGEVPTAGSPVMFDATGELTVAGVTNVVRFPITMKRIGPAELLFSGGLNLKMSDFRIRPPVVTVLGVPLRTADPIKLSWSWRVGLAEETAAR